MGRGRRLLLLLALAVLACTRGRGQEPKKCGADAGSSIATDRPQITNSSIVVPCGSLQFENGWEETASGGRQGFDLPETSVRFGLWTKTELRLAAPDYFYNLATNSGVAGYSGFSNGFGDTVVGLKQQLGPLPGKIDLSVIPQVSLPTGTDEITSHGYDPSVQAPWSRAVGKNWTAAGMFSALWPTQLSGANSAGQNPKRRNLTGQSSLYVDRQLTAPWDAYVEYSGMFPQRGGPQHMINFGTAYKLTPHQQLDLHCTVALSAAAAPDHAVGVGYSVRFQVRGRKQGLGNRK